MAPVWYEVEVSADATWALEEFNVWILTLMIDIFASYLHQCFSETEEELEESGRC